MDIASNSPIIPLSVGDFPCSIFDIVLKRITIRGSIVGTRQDMVEAIGFASRGTVGQGSAQLLYCHITSCHHAECDYIPDGLIFSNLHLLRTFFFFLSFCDMTGLVKCSVELASLSEIGSVFERLRAGSIKGRVVINMEA